uniref:Uncharacterized protein n=1 Tax=Photinus pyralis TaxID=7054 RepID=A0A1Y1JYK3_PHOPY
MGNLEEAIYRVHQEKKKEAREEKAKDKTDERNKVYTMDLQSVLLAPHSNVSSLYYKKKLIVHNFTIYNIKTKEAFCFIWNETEGSVGANEFTTIICNFIRKESTNLIEGEEIILYSDGCAGQNRNSVLSNALLYIATEKKITIVQKYLERVHTQMEADSIHSSIERVLRKRKINVPADYIDVCLQARQNPEPYKVHYLTHDYFLNYAKLGFLASIRPGKKAGDPTVQDLRAIKYKPTCEIEYKLRHSHEWKLLPVRINKNPKIDILALYSERLKIKSDKFEHLQALKEYVMADYRDFYDNIPYNTN